MNDKPNMEELLNGFIDGELSERQRVEVQRLISHDVHVAGRLRELQECKTLVGSLPRAEAPPDTLEQVKAALETRALMSQWSLPDEQRRGARHLLFRKVMTAAAMIGLVAVLGAVVYTIVLPEGGAPPMVAQHPRGGETSVTAIKTAGAAAPAFYGRLEFKTPNLLAVDATVNQAIEDNSLSDGINLPDKNLYEVSCGGKALGLLLADLEYVWQRLDSARFIVETDRFGEQIVIEDVRPEQIAEIVGQTNPMERVRLAKEFAISNRVEKLSPGREILAAIEGGKADWAIVPPKPVIASDTKTPRKTTTKVDEQKNVHLSIAITSSR
ncbi:MAG: anti-sigma factor family protein [Planctomycetota bacterium]|jgi:hypothetical protein